MKGIAKTAIKEAAIFFAILFALALLWHNDLLSQPFARLDRLMNSANVSPLHPFIWSAIFYLSIGLFRLPNLIVKKFRKKEV
ncbi:MAG: hypothetical protein LBQ52_03485 [Helicobacteraceae bacterium]|jgi:hypothetical protein|nr:hypothetical protein [Helicobacteraceae bacterium]